MTINLEIPKYTIEHGLPIHWEYNFVIEVNASNNVTTVKANKAGLVSLAIQLLTLAQDNVELSTHIHYDTYNSLVEGSCELIIEKI